MIIPDPGPLFFPISDPRSLISDPGSIKICYHTFFCSPKFHKIQYVIFEMVKKKIWANFQRIVEVFTQNFSICSQIYGFGIRDLVSGKNLSRIPDPGVKKAPDPGSATLVLTESEQHYGKSLSYVRYMRCFGS